MCGETCFKAGAGCSRIFLLSGRVYLVSLSKVMRVTRYYTGIMSENLPQAPLTSTFATLVSLKSLWGGALRDTISSQGHSRDFAYARIDYLRSRVFVVGIIFLLLTPFWAIIDAMMLPDDTRSYVMAGRIAMVLGLVLATLMAWRSTGKICLAKLSASVLFGVPAAFYVFVLAGLPAQWSGSLVGYSFIPFMLMVMLSIFPFTLIESAALGVVLLAVECYACTAKPRMIH